MHAVVINVTISDRSAAQAELSGLVPQVSAAPGFIAGYWIALSQDKGTAIHVFDSEASAQTLVAQVESAPAGAVTAESVEVGEVIAHA
jgi:hypothetical protein